MNLDQELDKVSQDIDETREALRRVRGTNDSLEAKYVSLLEVLLKKEDRLIAEEKASRKGSSTGLRKEHHLNLQESKDPRDNSPPYPEISPLSIHTSLGDDDHHIQLELTNINSAKSELSAYKGFRNFIVSECHRIGLYGYVWREPTTRGKILARGTKSQIHELLTFCEELRNEKYIEGYFSESPVDYHVVMKGFCKLPSKRKFVQTGIYSDDEYDKVLHSPRNSSGTTNDSGGNASESFYPASPVYLVPHEVKNAPAIIHTHGGTSPRNSASHSTAAHSASDHHIAPSPAGSSHTHPKHADAVGKSKEEARSNSS